jgi:non-ribosomal peptide synthetase component F
MNGVAAKSDKIEPDRSDLPGLATIKREQSLVEANRTGGQSTKEKCLHELFQEQAERSPDAVAVSYEGRELSRAR